ncbi:MAG: nitronate monooxygenase, partial [Patescibacteria group bacterium]|nr:nitronate monooxygenase [Patescibacteria group bacterium]
MDNSKLVNTPLKIGNYIIDKPVIQGGMGVGISWDQLAGTVSNEGALGVISTVGTGYFDYPKYLGGETLTVPSAAECNSKEALIEIFRRARLICGNKPLAVNIMHVLTGYKQNVIDSCEAGADIIICGAGLAVDLPGLTKDYPNVALVPIVSSAKALRILSKRWARFGKVPDAVVVEGPLSGGHQGVKKEDCFLPE